jgi:5'-nucleotidase
MSAPSLPAVKASGARRWLSLAFAVALLDCTHRPGGSGSGPGAAARVKLLAINDFHGQLTPTKPIAGRPAGSAPVLAAHLRAAMAGSEDRTILVEAGDLVGASPAASALLLDEPAVAFFDLFANSSCGRMPPPSHQAGGPDRFAPLFDPGCNLVGVPGNHEFDRGVDELVRLLAGGNHPSGPFLEDPWRGARFPVVAANVRTNSGGLLFRPYVVKSVDGVRLAFVGAAQRHTPSMVSPAGVAGLAFGDEVDGINAQVPQLQRLGIHAIVAVVHDGGAGQAHYAGGTDRLATTPSAELKRLVARLDPDVDVLVSAHTHSFANLVLPNAGGRDVLVVQAYSAGTAFADIDLTVDRAGGDVLAKSARIVTAFADTGLAPDPDAARLTAAAEAKVAPLTRRVVARAAGVVGRAPDAAGQTPLGQLVADAERAAVKGAEFAVTNAGGIRADLPSACPAPPCPITWGDCFAAQPFRDRIVPVSLTGSELQQVLERQWGAPGERTRMLQVSGFKYAYSESAPRGRKVVPGSLRRADGTPIERDAHYLLAVNSFLAEGGSGFGVLADLARRPRAARTGDVEPLDLDALVSWLERQPPPIAFRGEARVERRP